MSEEEISRRAVIMYNAGLPRTNQSYLAYSKVLEWGKSFGIEMHDNLVIDVLADIQEIIENG